MGRVQQGVLGAFFHCPPRAVEVINRYWDAIEWDFQEFLGVNALDFVRELPGRTWDQFLRFFDRLLQLEGSAVLEAYLNDPEVIEEMAKSKDRTRVSKPRLWRYSQEFAALRDLCDQMIASRGGSKFVPRPEIPGHAERWRRKDSKLSATVARITGND